MIQSSVLYQESNHHHRYYHQPLTRSCVENQHFVHVKFPRSTHPVLRHEMQSRQSWQL